MKNLDSTADHAHWTIENGDVLDMLHLLDENTFDGLTPLDFTPSDLGSALLAVPPEAWEGSDEDRTPHRHVLCLHGKTYKTDPLSKFPPVKRSRVYR